MAKKKVLLQTLADELGVKIEDIEASIRRKQSYASNVKGMLEEGKGFGEAFGTATKDKITSVKEAFSKKGIKKFGKKFRNELISGDDIFSSYLRGRVRKKEDADLEKAGIKPGSPSKLGGDDLSVIAENSKFFQGMASDVNILRQNIVKLLDTEKLKQKENIVKEEAADVSGQKDFFKQEDAKEAGLETKPTPVSKYSKKTSPTPAGKEETGGGGGLLDNIMGMFGGSLSQSLKSLLNPGAILKVLGKVFLIGALIMSLFKGITAGFEKFKESGDLGEAIITGFGAILDFLTFGLFGEDTVRDVFKSVGDFMEPIIDSIKETYFAFKDWVANNVGIPRVSFKVLGKEIGFGPYYPFKDNPKSEATQNTAGEFKAQRMAEKVAKEESKATDTINQVSKDLGVDSGSISKEVNKNIEKASTLVKDLPKNKKDQADVLGNLQSLTEKNLDNIKKLNKKGDFSLGKAEDYEKNVVDPVRNKLDQVKKTIQAGPPGGMENMISGSLGKAADAISSKISAGGPSENSLGGGASMLGGGGGGGGSSPTPTGGGSTMGANLAASSTDIAEKQRMESSADVGSSINSPTTNKSIGNSGNNITPQVSDVYNMDLINLLGRA